LLTDEEESPAYWYELGQKEIERALGFETFNMKVAKNVIFFLGKFCLVNIDAQSL